MEKQHIENIRRTLMGQIGEHIEKNNISQGQIAEKTGFIQSNISRMLSGKYPPTLDNLIALCNAVGLKIEVKSTMYPTLEE
jgi:predicted XRE-type DNA-binding protein